MTKRRPLPCLRRTDFELTEFPATHHAALNMHVGATESGNDIVFLHGTTSGSCQQELWRSSGQVGGYADGRAATMQATPSARLKQAPTKIVSKWICLRRRRSRKQWPFQRLNLRLSDRPQTPSAHAKLWSSVQSQACHETIEN
jgi:hypothetical protein